MRAAPAAAAVAVKVNKNCRRFCDANIRPRCGAAEWYAGESRSSIRWLRARAPAPQINVPSVILAKLGRLDAVEAFQINGHALAFAPFFEDLGKLRAPG